MSIAKMALESCRVLIAHNAKSASEKTDFRRNISTACVSKSCVIVLLLVSVFVSVCGSDEGNTRPDRVVLRELIQGAKGHRLEMISKVLAKHRQSRSSKQPLENPESNVLKALKRNKRDTRRSEASYYVDEILWSYGDLDAMSLENFEVFLAHIGLKKMTRFANDTTHDHDHHDHDHEHEHHDDGDHGDHDHDHDDDDHGHDDHDHDHDNHDHDHDHHDHDHDDHNHDHDDHEHDYNDLDHVHRRKRQATDPQTGNDDNNTNVEQELECLTSSQLLSDYGLEGVTSLTPTDFLLLCPALVFQLDQGVCHSDSDGSDARTKKGGQESEHGVDELVWLYTMLCVVVISLCALFGILCIPKHGGNENIFMQFLIAVAMASMSGDGLLHLIPHAMVPHHDHGEEEEEDHHDEDEGHLDSLYKGLVVLIGTYAFFFLERIFAIMKTRNNQPRRNGASTPMVGVNSGAHEHDEMDGHGHTHGGICNCTSLATMIIVGDMFHNFCDGLAIGAAFAGSLSLGLSTAIAVFCHELPHEIGDFAVLITSGMNRKRAIAFNMLSTVPCFLGAAIGLELGSLGDLSLWIFAFVGGLFIYIALVDLVPEMTRAYTRPGSPWGRYLLVHSVGMALGVIIMLVLGIYEHDLQQILT